MFFSSIGTAGRLGQLSFRFVLVRSVCALPRSIFNPSSQLSGKFKTWQSFPNDRTCKHLFFLFMQVNVMIFLPFCWFKTWRKHFRVRYRCAVFPVFRTLALDSRYWYSDYLHVYFGHNALLYEYLKDFIDLHTFWTFVFDICTCYCTDDILFDFYFWLSMPYLLDIVRLTLPSRLYFSTSVFSICFCIILYLYTLIYSSIFLVQFELRLQTERMVRGLWLHRPKELPTRRNYD